MNTTSTLVHVILQKIDLGDRVCGVFTDLAVAEGVGISTLRKEFLEFHEFEASENEFWVESFPLNTLGTPFGSRETFTF